MQEKWRTFWKEAFSHGRSVLIALGIGVIIFISNLSDADPADYGISLLMHLMFSLNIFGFIWICYLGLWAIITHFGIDYDTFLKKNWVVHIVTSVSGVFLGLTASKYLQALILDKVFTMDGMTRAMVIGIFITLAFLFYYAYKEAEHDNERLAAQNSKAELNALKNQMQPHFLFNSLNSLSELIATDEGAAANMAQKLSDLYRKILQCSEKNLTSLQNELEIIQAYLDLEKIRFGDRLSYSLKVPDNTDAIMLPPLVLQTLVENAIKHGIAPSLQGGSVHLAVKAVEDGYSVQIENSSAGSFAIKDGGTGVKNTKERLSLLYGSKHGFKLEGFKGRAVASFWISGRGQND